MLQKMKKQNFLMIFAEHTQTQLITVVIKNLIDCFFPLLSLDYLVNVKVSHGL